jgi:nucleotide-binding universal stress UspA family protein
MLQLKTIALAHDLSDASFSAFTEACALARTFDAEVLLVHAIPEAPESSQDFDVVATKVEELFRDLRHAPEADGVRFGTPVVKAADPARLVLATAIEQSVDLIMLGSGEKTSLDRILLGSTAEKVVREATKPVWLVRPGRPHPEVRRMVCALDESTAAQEALGAAAFLARTFVASLSLLSVAPPGEVDAQKAKLEAAKAKLDLHGIQVQDVVREGEVVPELVAALSDQKADLLVLGTAGRKGLARLLHANTAEKVIRLAPCSILTVRSPR